MKNRCNELFVAPVFGGKIVSTMGECMVNVVEAVDVLAASFIKDYGTYVLMDRAVPSMEDGLKPGQRRLLYTMYTLGLRDTGKHMKAARVTGTTMAVYHPHSSAFGALARMCAGIPAPFVDGYGNWGSHATEPAAERYVECRFTKLGFDNFFDPFYFRCIDTVPNYDGTTTEPVVLPSVLPMILAIGQSGLAVGTTTNIPSFTIDSLKKVIRILLKKSSDTKLAKATPELLAKHLEFSSVYGGKVISDTSAIVQVMATGAGPIEWSCDYTVHNPSAEMAEATIIITGMPDDWNHVSRLKRLNTDVKYSFVKEAMDNTDRNGIKLTIRLKRATINERKAYIAKLEKEILTCTSTYRVNVNKRDKTTNAVGVVDVSTEFSSKSIVDLLNDWLHWRVYTLEYKAFKEELCRLRAALAKEELLILAIDNLDVIFSLLKKKNIDKVAELADKLRISIDQSKYIWSMAVGSLDRLSKDKVLIKIDSIEQEIAYCTKALTKLPTEVLKSKLLA